MYVEVLKSLQLVLVNRDHVRDDSLVWLLLKRGKLSTLELLRCLLDQAGLAIALSLLLLFLLDATELAHVHGLSNYIILLENECGLLLLVLLNLLDGSPHICIHL